MLDHIKILIGFVCLLIGTGTIVYLRQIYRKYRQAVLRTVYQYAIYMLLLFCAIVISKYIQLNLQGNQDLGRVDVYLNTGTLVLILIQIGMLYTLLSSCLHLNQLHVSLPALNIGFIAAIALVCGSYLLRIILAEYEVILPLLNRIHSMLWNSLSLLELPLLTFFVLYRNRSLSTDQRRLSRSFAILYWLRFPVVLLLLQIARTITAEGWKLLFPVGFFLLYIFTPLIWIKFYFLPYAHSLLQRAQDAGDLAAVCTNFGISKREREILELLISGKTNTEIAEALFIALPTVKNHVSSIYRKLNVKSRYQLIHLLTSEAE